MSETLDMPVTFLEIRCTGLVKLVLGLGPRKVEKRRDENAGTAGTVGQNGAGGVSEAHVCASGGRWRVALPLRPSQPPESGGKTRVRRWLGLLPPAPPCARLHD